MRSTRRTGCCARARCLQPPWRLRCRRLKDRVDWRGARQRQKGCDAPIAIPTSAAASAGESFTPSPTNATVVPPSCRRRTAAALSAGCTPASTHSGGIPTMRATAAAAAALSPVTIQTCQTGFTHKQLATLRSRVTPVCHGLAAALLHAASPA